MMVAFTQLPCATVVNDGEYASAPSTRIAKGVTS